MASYSVPTTRNGSNAVNFNNTDFTIPATSNDLKYVKLLGSSTITGALGVQNLSVSGTTTLSGTTNLSTTNAGTLTTSGLITATGGLTTGSSASLTLRATQPIIGMARGLYTGGAASGTVSFGYTFSTAPIVTANVASSLTTSVFSMMINNVTTTGFSFSKTYWNGTTLGVASENFYWIAIG